VHSLATITAILLI